ncbi:serine/threonine-protein kinase [Ruania zhangjianzhongii]|uniref:serine/threonine-protein kinase n=1 Tax=Ruania zhangjianzhongii TaxID=2603206 RepID=UPI0011C8A2CD|nr:serine/threonine-protein kinase [Ruania zhangjianzhongii]
MKPAAGLLLGERYELTERLAIGGMGEVWVATDLNLRRHVAAKVLREEFAGDQHFLGRLRAEAVNSAALTHQNIAAMYDYGEQRGSGYLIMELVRGESLEELLRREHTLEPSQVLPVLAQTARALHAAHRAGVVHRDVKPSNILITPDGNVKITDFGISLGSNQAPMTAAGMVMGTAQYLPPEQAMGRAATGAGDIYALGVVAYESLVGKRPFTGTNQVDIAFAHVKQPLPPLPDSLDPRVREVVEQMLAKDPEARPRSAASLARTLEAIASALEVVIEPERPATSVGGTPPAGMTTAEPGSSDPLTSVGGTAGAAAADSGGGPAGPGNPSGGQASSAAQPSSSPQPGSAPLGPPTAAQPSVGSRTGGGGRPVQHGAEAAGGAGAAGTRRGGAEDDAPDEDDDNSPLLWRPLAGTARTRRLPNDPDGAPAGGGAASSRSRHDSRRAAGAHRRHNQANPLVSALSAQFGSAWWWPLVVIALAAIGTIAALWFTRLGAANAAWALSAALVLPTTIDLSGPARHRK